MSKQCINNNCQSPRNSEQLLKVKKSVCKYYNVNYKSYLRVCWTCWKKCKLNHTHLMQLRTQNVNRSNIERENLTGNKKSVAFVNSDNAREDGSIKTIKLPTNRPKPIFYNRHRCSRSCLSRVTFDYSKTKRLNVLSIPLRYGFTRCVTSDENSESKKVTYTTPCGLKINDEREMFKYLKVTGYGNRGMTIDLFSFDHMVEPLNMLEVQKKFIRMEDISFGKEFKAITVVNCFSDFLPKTVEYITECQTIPISFNVIKPHFSCGCDCTDNCEDKTKCSCWQLTYEGPNSYPELFRDSNVGYSYKRLHEPVFTGIFECNIHCKCAKICLNRVAQEPMKTSLQLFLTGKKGWGVRTLADIPKGSFICTLIGVVRSEKNTNNNCATNMYQADLDFIRGAEETIDAYERNLYQSEEIESSHRMTLKKRVRAKNTKMYGKRYSLLRHVNKDGGLYTLDAKFSGNIGRYFNHSCDPNIFVQNVFIDTHDLRFPTVAHFALSNIPAGTELAWDYNYNITNVKNQKKKKCYCGSENCKRRLF